MLKRKNDLEGVEEVSNSLIGGWKVQPPYLLKPNNHSKIKGNIMKSTNIKTRTGQHSKNEVLNNDKKVLCQIIGRQHEHGQDAPDSFYYFKPDTQLKSVPKNVQLFNIKDANVAFEVLDNNRLRWEEYVDVSSLPNFQDLNGYEVPQNINAWTDTLTTELAKTSCNSTVPVIEFISENEMKFSVELKCDTIFEALTIRDDFLLSHLNTFRESWKLILWAYGVVIFAEKAPKKP